MDNKCRTCRWWNNCECQRHAPSVLNAPDTRGVFPITAYNGWCGDWESADKKCGLIKGMRFLLDDGTVITYGEAECVRTFPPNESEEGAHADWA